jgi:hypothetical protein
VREESEQYQQQVCSSDHKAPVESKNAIEADCKTKKIPQDARVPDKAFCLGNEMAPKEEAELLAFHDKNNDVFAWSTSDLNGVSSILSSTNCKWTQ